MLSSKLFLKLERIEGAMDEKLDISDAEKSVAQAYAAYVVALANRQQIANKTPGNNLTPPAGQVVPRS
jgi:hypothetical protein